MGIPSFYRWLTDRYPLIIADVQEERPLVINGVSVPIHTSCPNPNGFEFDNLYLDMNGIIHPCFHPEGLPAPTTYEDVFAAVFKYIDRIFSIVRPRKLLFMAIDGVAPRAKMNQQRSRRFRSAKDAADQASSIERDGGIVSESEEGKLEQVKKLDMNVITPGTEFMDLLSSALHSYICLRMKKDLGWRGIKVILSDANVPGEGEHKIMSYIRLQRNLPGFDPNTRHCLYGLDADLIMLALASHEIHFSIIRENLGNASIGGKTLKEKHRLMKRRKLNGNSKQVGKFVESLEDHISGLKFQFLNVWILREYLAYDMRISDAELKVDLERVIDDFVFMCLLVGNDFLPHIPSLEISEGAIDLLMTVYKREFAQMGGYLTNSIEINLTRVEHFVQALGSHESAIFRRRNQMQKEREIHFQRVSKRQQTFPSSKSFFDNGLSESNKSYVKLETAPLSQNRQNPCSMDVKELNHCSSNGTSAVVDKIKLGDEGWKERFYAEKFEAKSEDERETIRRHAVSKYVEGICWVMRYYYEGVCSWQWFYPYHYAPFASDFFGCGQLEIHFTPGEPFKPFNQLMAVLPAARKLMTDATSPILDFYPTEFELDINGKRFSWQAICKLPFIEESRLLSEIAKVEHMLTDEERRRNRLGYDVLCVHVSHPLAVTTISVFDQSTLPKANVKLKIDPKISGGMNGYIYISDKPEWPLEIYSPIDGMPMIASNQVKSVFYEYPPFHSHIPRLPEGVILPNKSVTKRSRLHAHHLWHEPAVSGRVSSKRPIPKSISGPQLAKLARQLVSEYNFSKHQDFHRCAERGFPLDADRMGEMSIQAHTKKREQGKCNKNCLDGRSKERQVGKGDFVPINNVENLESSTLRQERESCGDHGSTGLDEIKIDKSKLESCIQEQRNSGDAHGGAKGENDYKAKSRKRKQRNKKENQNDGDAVLNKNGDKLGSKLQSCILQEQSGGDVHAGGDGALELKTEVKSKKWRKIEADGILINNVEKLGSSLMEQRGGDNNHTNAYGLDATRSPVPNNNHQELEVGVLELKTEVKSKKRKRRSKGRRKIEADGVLINNVENLESCSPMEQRGGDSNHTNAYGLDTTRSPVPNNNHQEVEAPVPNNNHQELEVGALELKTEVLINSDENLEKCSVMEQRGGDSNLTNADGLDATRSPVPNNIHREVEAPVPNNNHQEWEVGALELKTEVLINNVENLESSSVMEQRGGDSNLTNANGLDATRSPVPNNNHQELEVGALELKTEVKSKKRKRRSKGRRKIEADGVLINNVENLESCSLMEQRGGDSNLTSADGLDATRSPVPNNNHQELEVGALELKAEVLINNVENLESSSVMEQRGGDSNLTSADGLDATRSPVPNNNNQELEVGALELKTEVKSKKRKRRSKGRKKIEADGVLINNVDNLESCSLMEQRGGDSNLANADGLDSTRSPVPNNNHQELEFGTLELKTEVKSKKKKRRSKGRRKIEADGVLFNNVKNLGGSLMEQRGGDSYLTIADGLDATRSAAPNNNYQELEHSGRQEQIEHGDHSGANGVEIEPAAISKRKKRRSKKKQQMEHTVPTDDPQNLQSGVPGKQGAFDVNHIGVGGLEEMKTEV